LQPAELTACVTDVYLCGSRQTFSNRYSYSFSPILTELGTHDLCADAENCGTDFQNLDFWQIFKFLILCRQNEERMTFFS